MPSLNSDDRYITIAEFCSKYSISRATLYQLTHARDFPYVKIGGAVRIPEQGAHEWIVEHSERRGAV